MHINKTDNLGFGMALKIDRGLKKELQTKPDKFIKNLNNLGEKIADVRLFNVVFEEGKGFERPVIKSSLNTSSPDYFLNLKSEERNLGKWYEVPSGAPGDTVGGFFPDEPHAFRKLYGKDAAKKYKEFKTLDLYNQAAEYSRMLEQIEIKRLIQDEKKKSEEQVAKYMQKVMQEKHENNVDELLSRYENDTIKPENKNINKPSFWSKIVNFIKK